jgi:phage repressor protein C with HTH and peptisase S24 domain
MIWNGRLISALLFALGCSCFASPLLAGPKIQATYIAGTYVISPAAQFATPSTARLKAYEIATAIPGAYVIEGRGRSMLPLYQSGTLLVVRPTPFEKLSRGMSVVFRSHNRSITHVLVAKTKDGWRTTGLNNRRHDYISVNSDNIRGVVVAAFTPVTGTNVVMR